jgi:hypothetical protein
MSDRVLHLQTAVNARPLVNLGARIGELSKRLKELGGWACLPKASLLMLSLVTAHAQNPGQVANMTWPEATAQIAKLRTTSETCVSVIKQYGRSAQKAQARIDYGHAKSSADAIITGLTTALFTSGETASLPTLTQDLNLVASDLSKLCDSATSVLPSSSGHKGPLDDIVKAAIEPLLKAVSDGVSALYNNHRADKELIKKTIQSQLEAARWQEFDKIAPGR